MACLPLSALKPVSHAFEGENLLHLFSQKSNEDISGKSLSDMMNHIHFYEFHRSTHEWETAPLVGEFGKKYIVVTQCSVVKVTAVSLLKSDPTSQ